MTFQHDSTHVCFDFSAGVGRTGTLIALDFLLEQAGCEKVIDIYNCVYNMRKNRVNMIQTLVGDHNIPVMRCGSGGLLIVIISFAGPLCSTK